MFGHWFEILLVLLVGLLVFGPKRLIEMGSQLGKAVRELRESTRDINFSSLLSADETPRPPTYASPAQARPAGEPVEHHVTSAETRDEQVVESVLDHGED